MSYSNKLLSYGKKTILKEDLGKLFSAESDRELFHIVSDLEEHQLLVPVKASKTNGNNQYPLYLKYKITLPAESYDSELAEIASLHPQLQASGYLQSKPREYQKYRAEFQKLDRYLFVRSQQQIDISRKERSFEIFGEEKILDDRNFTALLKRMGMDEKSLHFYDTPEFCFNDFIPERKSSMTLLICENKDIWFNIRRMMFEECASILFDTHIDGVVYGCGNKITGDGALASYTNFMGAERVSYLYWGDIDREGLNIYLRLTAGNPQMNMKLFVPAYEKMLQLAQNIEIPQSADAREVQGNYQDIFASVKTDLQEIFKKSIQDNKRIPQEIISYAFLKENMRV